MQDTPVIIQPPDITKCLDLKEYFPNQADLEVDIGCGKGKFLVAHAKNNPAINFLGIDRLTERLEIIQKKVLNEKLSNVRLLNLENSYAIKYLLPPESVSTFYVFFPDPWPKRRHHRRRLFTVEFINTIHEKLQPDGKIHIATDFTDYYEVICKLMRAQAGFSEIDPFIPEENERTNFETLFMKQGKQIGRCSFRKQ